jgi:hypothetical protein
VNILDYNGNTKDPEGMGKRKSPLFTVGIVLIAISFLIYPFYLIIPILTISLRTKTILFFTGLVFSWGLFGAGGLMAGREGYPHLKAAMKKIFKNRDTSH